MEIELGELDLVVKPKEKMPNGLRKLAEPLRAQSNLVSQRNGESEYTTINWRRRRSEQLLRRLLPTVSKMQQCTINYVKYNWIRSSGGKALNGSCQ